MQQASEAMDERFLDANIKNLAGWLPAGQKFDDPDEPNVIQYLEDLAGRLGDDRAGAIRQFLDDYLVRSQEKPEGEL
jgi:hypothetical protein